jgi:cell fate regulator YaaT (PSP1 superfamily)
MAESGTTADLAAAWAPPASVDEARALARERFKERLQAGEQIGNCACGDEEAVLGRDDGSPPERVAGVRFRDSGRVYYFQPNGEELAVGDWVVVPTTRGHEAARVVIAPHQVRRSMLHGDLRAVVRRLDTDDVQRMEAYRRKGAEAVRTFGERVRRRRLGVKPITANYSFDGAAVTLNYSVPDRERAPDAAVLRDLVREMASALGCRVDLRQVGPRDEARLLGGLGRCGRTLCCSSWLPVFPEISMGMAKNQDLPLNPSKVSGVCGRLLCCLSYENDQYRQMKAVMPKLGQTIETPGGAGQVIAMQLLRELVTVRLQIDNTEVTFRSEELGFGASPNQSRPLSAPAPMRLEPEVEASPDGGAGGEGSERSGDAGASRRRRRRRGGKRGADGSSGAGSMQGA